MLYFNILSDIYIYIYISCTPYPLPDKLKLLGLRGKHFHNYERTAETVVTLGVMSS